MRWGRMEAIILGFCVSLLNLQGCERRSHQIDERLKVCRVEIEEVKGKLYTAFSEVTHRGLDANDDGSLSRGLEDANTKLRALEASGAAKDDIEAARVEVARVISLIEENEDQVKNNNKVGERIIELQMKVRELEAEIEFLNAEKQRSR